MAKGRKRHVRRGRPNHNGPATPNRQSKAKSSMLARLLPILTFAIPSAIALATIWIAYDFHEQDKAEREASEQAAERRHRETQRTACQAIAMQALQAANDTSQPAKSVNALASLGVIGEPCEMIGGKIFLLADDTLRSLSNSPVAEISKSSKQVVLTLEHAARRSVAATPAQQAVASDQLENVGDLVAIARYGGGRIVNEGGLLSFKKHVDNPSENELREAIGPGVVANGTLPFPEVE